MSRPRDARSLVLFAGGGTGGHLTPGLAVADELRQRCPDRPLLFLASEREIDQRILSRTPYESAALATPSLSGLRSRPWSAFPALARSFFAAWRLVMARKPAVVVGLGGFASAPVVFAAARQRIPVVLLEQNLLPGRATRWLARYATTLCLSFAESCEHLPARARNRVRITGNPVRAAIRMLHEVGSNPRAAETEGAHQLLILGGSLGAQSLNRAMIHLLSTEGSDGHAWRVLHQTGPRDAEFVRSNYTSCEQPVEVVDFLTDLPEQYPRTTLVVSRAGATSLAEFACAGLPAILVPYPHAAEDHQRWNAEPFVQAGAAKMVLEGTSPEETAERLRPLLRNLLTDAAARRSMGTAMHSLARPDAAIAVADCIEELIA